MKKFSCSKVVGIVAFFLALISARLEAAPPPSPFGQQADDEVRQEASARALDPRRPDIPPPTLREKAGRTWDNTGDAVTGIPGEVMDGVKKVFTPSPPGSSSAGSGAGGGASTSSASSSGSGGSPPVSPPPAPPPSNGFEFWSWRTWGNLGGTVAIFLLVLWWGKWEEAIEIVALIGLGILLKFPGDWRTGAMITGGVAAIGAALAMGWKPTVWWQKAIKFALNKWVLVIFIVEPLVLRFTNW